jgi:hypothetical protein
VQPRNLVRSVENFETWRWDPAARTARVRAPAVAHRHIVTRLAAIGVRREDIQIAVTENHYEDWYAGRLHGE